MNNNSLAENFNDEIQILVNTAVINEGLWGSRVQITQELFGKMGPFNAAVINAHYTSDIVTDRLKNTMKEVGKYLSDIIIRHLVEKGEVSEARKNHIARHCELLAVETFY